MSEKMKAIDTALKGGFPAGQIFVIVGNAGGHVPAPGFDEPGVIVFDDMDNVKSGYFVNNAGERKDISELTGLAVINALKERDEERQRNLGSLTAAIKRVAADWYQPPKNLAKGPTARNRFARGGR